MQQKQLILKKLRIIAKRQNWSKQKLKSARGQIINMTDEEAESYLTELKSLVS